MKTEEWRVYVLRVGSFPNCNFANSAVIQIHKLISLKLGTSHFSGQAEGECRTWEHLSSGELVKSKTVHTVVAEVQLVDTVRLTSSPCTVQHNSAVLWDHFCRMKLQSLVIPHFHLDLWGHLSDSVRSAPEISLGDSNAPL